MKHFLITRFNLRVDAWKDDKKGNPVLSDRWMEKRFDLFSNYCLPSVINQVNKNFTWLLFFDTSTSEKQKEKIKELTTPYSFVKVVFIDGHDMLQESCVKEIKDYLSGGEKYVLTTRLDNDDALSIYYIENIQKVAKENKGRFLIDPQYGYQIDVIKNPPIVRNYHRKSSQFISLKENVDDIKTIFSRSHNGWEGVERVVTINEKKPLWVEVVHDSNKLNTHISSSLPFSYNLQEFGIANIINTQPKIKIFYLNILFGLIKTKSYLKSLVKKLM